MDSKLIKQQTKSQTNSVETIELQNGCVCCSLAEDLMASVSNLVTMADMKGESYDHIVVECSGIAEPRKMRELFQQAEDFGSPLLYSVELDTLITIVDAKLFFDTFGSDTNINSKAELAYRAEDVEGRKSLDGDAGSRLITELLLEQVECADVVLINKCDLLPSAEDVQLVEKVIFKINPTAKVMTCVNGVIENPTDILGYAKGEGAVSWGILDEHRKMLEAVEKEIVKETDHECTDSTCKDPSHHHDHGHEHHAETCVDETCKDPSHHHNHDDHSHASAACADSTCTDATHDHSHVHEHSHDSAAGAECADTTCNDPTHNHDHSHTHNNKKTTAEERFGITSLIYRRRRPFHPIRLSRFLQSLGTFSVKGFNDIASTATLLEAEKEMKIDSIAGSRKALLRSKGFVWMASSKSTVYFWSHAGQYIELMVLGRWWADIHERDWPEKMAEEIKIDFDGDQGDRRQELVFIGQFSDSGINSKKSLEELLDSCLVTDEEFENYKKIASNGDEALRNAFFNNKKRTDFDEYSEQLQRQEK